MKRRLVLGLDFETTGLDPKQHRITEIGAVLWDWERKQPIRMISELVWDSALPIDLDPKIQKITGIMPEDLKEHSLLPGAVLDRLLRFVGEACCLMAHNAPFDMGFLYSELAHAGFQKPQLPQVVDTRTDIAWDPDLHKSRALIHLAASHGFLNPFAHRAVFDVLTMLRVASEYDLDEMIRRAKSPSVILTAHVSYDERDLAKQAGFHWQPQTKTWEMQIKLCDLRDDMGWGFRTSAREPDTVPF